MVGSTCFSFKRKAEVRLVEELTYGLLGQRPREMSFDGVVAIGALEGSRCCCSEDRGESREALDHVMWDLRKRSHVAVTTCIKY